jgi:alkylation response protein AidB-like acyl-CoA dehydrogenase
MDFQLTDEQGALRDLALTVLSRGSTPERLAELDAGDSWLDDRLWGELATSGLLGVSLPEQHGGGGASFLETCLLLEQVGATAAHVPVWATVVLAALPLARFGTREQAARDLPDVAAGQAVLSAALIEPVGEPASPATTARPDGDGWVLDGEKTCVPVGSLARRLLVSAQVTGPRAGGVGIFLLDPATPGVTLEEQLATDGSPQARLVLTGVRLGPEDVLGGPEVGIATGDNVLAWLLDRALTGLAAIQAGLTATVLRMTADYAKGREQFERPIASFQAVGHRLADAYVDVEAVRLSMLQAAWRLVEGLPAADAVAVAKFWAAEGGHRVLRAAHHVHGGMGVSLEYPLHRFTKLATVVEYTLGGALHQQRLIGSRLAAEAI